MKRASGILASLLITCLIGSSLNAAAFAAEAAEADQEESVIAEENVDADPADAIVDAEETEEAPAEAEPSEEAPAEVIPLEEVPTEVVPAEASALQEETGPAQEESLAASEAAEEAPETTEEAPKAAEEAPETAEEAPKAAEEASEAAEMPVLEKDELDAFGEPAAAEETEAPAEKQEQTVTIRSAREYTRAYGTGDIQIAASTDGDGELVYWSNNPEKVDVSDTGKITLTGVGNASIYVRARETDSYKQSDIQKVVVHVVRKKQAVTIKSATSYTRVLGTSDIRIAASTSGDGRLMYKSSNTSVAAVSSAGVISLKGAGMATISVYADRSDTCEKSAVKTVKVTVNPKAVTVSGVTNSAANQLNVTWTKGTGITGYQLEYSGLSSFSKSLKVSADAAAVSRVLDGVTKGNTYYVRIRAYKRIGNRNYYSAWSSAKSCKVTNGKTEKLTVAPVITVNASEDGMSNVITWDKLAGVSGYQVCFKKGSGSWALFKTTTATEVSRRIAHGSYYYYRVRAYKEKADGSRIFSNYSDPDSMMIYFDPDYGVAMSAQTVASTDTMRMTVYNYAAEPLTIYSTNARSIDPGQSAQSRNLTLVDASTMKAVSSVTIAGNSNKNVYFKVKGSNARYYKKTILHYEFTYDGMRYWAESSSTESKCDLIQ